MLSSLMPAHTCVTQWHCVSTLPATVCMSLQLNYVRGWSCTHAHYNTVTFDAQICRKAFAHQMPTAGLLRSAI
jgi:hypothetical protein